MLGWFQEFGNEDLKTFDLRENDFLRLINALGSIKNRLETVIMDLEEKTCQATEMLDQLFSIQALKEDSDKAVSKVDLVEDSDEEEEDDLEERQSDLDFIVDDSKALLADDEEFLPSAEMDTTDAESSISEDTSDEKVISCEIDLTVDSETTTDSLTESESETDGLKHESKEERKSSSKVDSEPKISCRLEDDMKAQWRKLSAECKEFIQEW